MKKALKRFFIGSPLRTNAIRHEKLSNIVALPIFASDALSSVAYATEEILLILVLAGAGALALSIPLSAIIIGLLALVMLSYRQVITAYPSAGGAYIVSKDNLGIFPAQIAGSALLIDYVLTVAVSVTAGVAAITSAFPTLRGMNIPIAIGFIAIITWANLRGVRESGKIFAVPTYLFILSMLLLLVVGFIKAATGDLVSIEAVAFDSHIAKDLSLFLILRAFAAGCTALTGVEAISNGVPAFKEPAAKNANKTLLRMTIILGVMFIGITVLARIAGAAPNEHETVISQIARVVFGTQSTMGHILYLLMQGATVMILILAANTSYAGFPLLASFLAKDKFLPRQLLNRGDRLVFSKGMFALSLSAIAFVVYSKGRVHNLIPLYAIGVFSSFTLAQFGMLKHTLIRKERNWKRGAVINALGGTATAIVLGIIVATKFTHGAWLILVLSAGLIAIFRKYKRHYAYVADDITAVRQSVKEIPHSHTYLLLVSDVHQPTMKALQYILDSQPAHVQAVHINLDTERARTIRREWGELGHDVNLKIIDCPYRDIVACLINYIEHLVNEWDDDIITVVIPVIEPKIGASMLQKMFFHTAHGQTAKIINQALTEREDVILEIVPYHLH